MTENEFDELIKRAGKIAIEGMKREDLELLDKICDVQFSKEHERQMKKIFKMARKAGNSENTHFF